jgi:single-strand DNA-binding protein
MSGVNKVILVGNVGKDPEMRHLEGNISVAKFPLATSEVYKKDGQRITQTEWHNVVLWRGLADVAEKYVKKGSLIYIEGRLRSSSWEDKDGVKKYKTEIVAENMTLLGRRPEDGSQSADTLSDKQTHDSEPISQHSSPDLTDDLPF